MFFIYNLVSMFASEEKKKKCKKNYNKIQLVA